MVDKKIHRRGNVSVEKEDCKNKYNFTDDKGTIRFCFSALVDTRERKGKMRIN